MTNPSCMDIDTSILVHDLKGPLAVIDTGAQSLLRHPDIYGPLTEKQVRVLHRILRNTRAARQLVGDVLEFGRSREGVENLTLFSVGQLIREVLVEIFDLFSPGDVEELSAAGSLQALEPIIREKGFALDIDPGVWSARICQDRARIRQILRNLISNAVKHRDTTVTLNGRLDGAHLILRVLDDGPGIPVSDQRRIFDAYFTTGRAGGSHGLGLSCAMHLLRDMAGSLTLNSGEGSGTEFTAVIPLKEPPHFEEESSN